MLLARFASIAIMLGAVCGACDVAGAHDGPEEVVAALTAEIERLGPSADRLYRRGSEYAALRNYVQAESDLRHAWELRRDFPTAQALVRVLISRGALTEGAALSAKLVAEQADRAPPDAALLALDAEVQTARGRWAEAVERFDAAIEVRPELDWYLQRSRAQAKLGRYVERVADLRSGLAKTDSPVLLGELCDALIARYAVAPSDAVALEARRIINGELTANRFRSTWLVRSARLSFAIGAQGPAQFDLYEALTELDGRIRADRPDVTLVAERAAAKLLLRRDDEARDDFLLARKHGAPDWLLEPLVAHFGDLPRPPTAIVD
jgi:tetratricopeptide (TPR) repeat protein